MDHSQRKYILANINKKSVSELSRELNLKERKIRKFLEEEKERKRQPDHLPEKQPAISKKAALISILLIVVLGFAVYSNSLDGKFVWDDEHLVQNNLFIKSFSNIPRVISEDMSAGYGRGFNFYRPLQVITYMFDYSFWKLNPRGYHLTNILLHIFVALAIFWFVSLLFNDAFLSALSAILFVIHPVHTEAIDYISGRADPLAALFILLCLIFYLKYLRRENLSSFLLMLLSCVLAFLSRESSFILVLLLLLYHYAFKKNIKLKAYLPILSIAFVYFVLRVTVLKHLLPGLARYTSTLGQRTPGFFVAVTNYFRIMLFPFDQHMEYGGEIFQFSNIKALLGVAILALLLFYIIRNKNRDSATFFGLSWFLLTLLPVSNLYPLNAYMAEHWLYLPSIGIFILIAKGLNSAYRIKKFKIPSVVLIIGLVSFYSYLTIRQNVYWREPIAFYERTLKFAPDSARVYNNLGDEYIRAGNRDKPMGLYEKATQLNPNYTEAFNNLGCELFNSGKLDEAISSFEKAIKSDPAYAESHANLAIIYEQKKQYDLAIKHFDRAKELGLEVTDLSEKLKPYRK